MKNNTEVITSKDVLNVDKIMKNFIKSPELSMEELTRIMAENFQAVQLGSMNVERCMDQCAILKAMSNNVLGTWALRSKISPSNNIRNKYLNNEKE